MENVPVKQCPKNHCKSCVKRRCKAYHAAYMRVWRAKRREQFAQLKAIVHSLGGERRAGQ